MELPESEVPPEKIWHHPERLTEWFDAVKHRRESGHKPIEEPEDAPMMQNELLDEMGWNRDG